MLIWVVSMFPTIGYLIQKIWGIVSYEIVTKKLFSIINILTHLKRSCFHQLDNLEKLIFVRKNWFNEVRVAYEACYDLVELIESKIGLEEN
jgi:hypothetical protein